MIEENRIRDWIDSALEKGEFVVSSGRIHPYNGKKPCNRETGQVCI